MDATANQGPWIPQGQLKTIRTAEYLQRKHLYIFHLCLLTTMVLPRGPAHDGPINEESLRILFTGSSWEKNLSFESKTHHTNTYTTRVRSCGIVD